MAKELTRQRMECGDLSPLWLSWNAKRRQVAALHTLRDPKCLKQFNFNLHKPQLIGAPAGVQRDKVNPI